MEEGCDGPVVTNKWETQPDTDQVDIRKKTLKGWHETNQRTQSNLGSVEDMFGWNNLIMI